MIYKLYLSNGTSMPVNEQELQKFKDNPSANFIELTAGIINPSFLVSIMVDTELTLLDNQKRIAQLNAKDFSDTDIKFLKEYMLDDDPYTIKNIDAIINRTLTIK